MTPFKFQVGTDEDFTTLVGGTVTLNKESGKWCAATRDGDFSAESDYQTRAILEHLFKRFVDAEMESLMWTTTKRI